MIETELNIQFEDMNDKGSFFSGRTSSSSPLLPHLMSPGNEHDYRDENSSLDYGVDIDWKPGKNSYSKSKIIGHHFKRVSRGVGSLLHFDAKEKSDLTDDQDVELMTITVLDGDLDLPDDSPLKVVSENVRVLSSKSLRDKRQLSQIKGRHVEKNENFANLSPRSVSGIDEISEIAKKTQGIYRARSSPTHRYITPSKSKVCFNENSADGNKIFRDSIMDFTNTPQYVGHNDLSRTQYQRKRLSCKAHRKINSWSHFSMPGPPIAELSTAQSFDNDLNSSKLPSQSIFKKKLQVNPAFQQNSLGNRSHSGGSHTAETIILEEYERDLGSPLSIEKTQEHSFELPKSMALETIQDDSPYTSPLTQPKKKDQKLKLPLRSGLKNIIEFRKNRKGRIKREK